MRPYGADGLIMRVEVTSHWGPEEGPRGSDAVAAVVRTWDMLARTAGPTTWYREGTPADHPVRQSDVPELLDAGRNRDDGRGEVIESLGRSIALYDKEKSSFSAATDGYAKTWMGHTFIEREGLPTGADDAWSLLEEQILLWGPRSATWGNKDMRKIGRRHGLGPGLPRLGMLTWIRDGVESPFTGGDTTHVHGGTLYRFGDRLEDVTQAVAERALGR